MTARSALALFTTVLITTGLVGLLAMISVVLGRFLVRRHDDHGGGDHPPLQPVPVGSAAELDNELFRILDDPRLADLSAHRQGRTPRRRPGARELG